MFRKWVSGLLVLVMLLGVLCIGAAEENSTRSIEASFLSLGKHTASEWCENEANRIVLAALAGVDIVASEYKDEFSVTVNSAVQEGSVYVETNGSRVIIYFFGEESMVAAFYSPKKETLDVSTFDIAAPSSYASGMVMRMMQREESDTVYYEVDGEDILAAIQALLESLS